jgi:hypothetical protein
VFAAARGTAEPCVSALAVERGAADGASSYHSLIPRRRRIFTRGPPTSDRVFEIIGGAVIVLVLAVAIATAFTMSSVVGVLGLLILVVVVGVLFSRRFG